VQIAPQFNQTDTAILQAFYDQLVPQVSFRALGANTALVFAYLMAHYLTLATNSNYATAGTMAEQSLGEASVKFNVSGDANNPIWQDLCRTQYGITYYSMLYRLVPPVMVSNQSPFMGGEAIALPPPPYGQLPPNAGIY
jgi:hypothetical protein